MALQCHRCHIIFPCSDTLNTHLEQGADACEELNEFFSKLGVRRDGVLADVIPNDANYKVNISRGTLRFKVEKGAKVEENFNVGRKIKVEKGAKVEEDFNVGRKIKVEGNAGVERERTHAGAHKKHKHECIICHTHFGYRSTLRRHLLIHLGLQRPDKVNSVSCSFCTKSFVNKSYLKIHEKVHRGEFDFECGVCRAQFATRSKLKQHAVVHEATRPYECASCRRTFKLLSAKKRHDLIHSATYAFKCEVCPAKFKVSDYLRRHVRVHHAHSSELRD